MARVKYECSQCHGEGRVSDLADSAFGTTEVITVICFHCEGDGYIVEEEPDDDYYGEDDDEPHYMETDSEHGFHPDGCLCYGCSPHKHREY